MKQKDNSYEEISRCTLKEARGILAEAQLEKRDLTTAEEKRYNALDKEIDEVGLLHDVAEASWPKSVKPAKRGPRLPVADPIPRLAGIRPSMIAAG